MRLRNYLLVQNIIIILVSITISGLILIQMSYNFHLKEEVKNLFREGKNIETNIRDIYIPSLKLDNINRFNFINDIDTQLDVMGNFFYKWDIRFRFYNSGVEIYNSSDEVGEQVFGKYIYKKVYLFKTIDDKTILFIGFPAFVDYESIFMVVEKDITHVKEYRNRQFFSLLLIILLFSIILLPLSYMVSRKVTDPIYTLISHIKNFHNRETKEIKRNDFKEIEFLYNSFEQLQVDILKQIKLLEEESVNKKQFLGKLNHEINTPITSIYGFSDLLLQSPYDEERYNRCLNHIKNESSRLKDLNKNLQKLFLPPDRYLWREVCLREIIEDVISSLEFLIDEKGIDIHISLQNSRAKGSPELLYTLIRNILHNAIKASYPSGKVEIIGVLIDDKFKIMVKDYGIGIKDEDLEHISEIYFTGKNVRDNSSGIGLDICREIIEHHNCSMEFRQNPEAGTTVILDFTTILQISDNSIKSEV